MSNNKTELMVFGNSNEWNKLINEVIASSLINSYRFEYKNFSNIQEIGSEVFGKVYRASLNYSHEYLTLKSLFNLDNTTVNEIVYEVIIIYFNNIFSSW